MPEVLTDEQVALIRAESGDIDDSVGSDGTGYEVSTAMLNIIYNDTSRGNLDLDRTIYYALRQSKAFWARQVESVSGGAYISTVTARRYQNIKDLLDDWGKITGLTPQVAGATLSVGALNLDLDATCNAEWNGW